jgi:hypothetical protein
MKRFIAFVLVLSALIAIQGAEVAVAAKGSKGKINYLAL